MNSKTAITSTIFQQSNLNHLPIMDRDTAEEIGQISHLWLDLEAHRVDSITCRAGLSCKTHTFKWWQIDTISKDSLLVSLPDSQKSQKAAGTADIVGCKLWTDAGNQAGIIDDYLIDPRNGVVIAYLFDPKGRLGFLNGQFQLPPSAIVSAGSKRVTALVSAVRDAQIWSAA